MCAEGHLLNSIQRLKLICHAVLKFKILLLNVLTVLCNLRFALKYQILSRVGCSAQCRDTGISSSSHEVQPFQGRSTTPWPVPSLCNSSEPVMQMWHSTAVVGYVSKMGLPTLDFAQGCKLILPSHEWKMCRERQQKRNRGSYLTWRSSRLHYQFMHCIKPGTSAFFAWEEHFPSVCSCLLMHGSWCMGQVPWQLPWGPTATTLQLLCAWTGPLLCPSQLGPATMVWLLYQAGIGRVYLWICSTKSGKVMCCRSTDTLPYHVTPRAWANGAEGWVGLSWAKRLKKQLQVVSEGSPIILWHHADLGLTSYLALCSVSTALIINFISKDWLHPLEVWLVSVSETDSAVVNCREGNKCSPLAFPIIF